MSCNALLTSLENHRRGKKFWQGSKNLWEHKGQTYDGLEGSQAIKLCKRSHIGVMRRMVKIGPQCISLLSQIVLSVGKHIFRKRRI